MMFEDTSIMEEFSTKQGFLFYSFPLYEEEKEKNSMIQLLWICTNIFVQSSTKWLGSIANKQKSRSWNNLTEES